MPLAAAVVVDPARDVGGVASVPGDKSISHRYALIAALADGRTTIANYAPGADCASTLGCVAALGAAVSHLVPDRDGDPPVVAIDGRGLAGLTAPTARLDCGNSGSTMRMLSGMVAAHPFSSTLVGDRSLSRRPMRRIITPLTRMGAAIDAGPGDCPPLTIHGARLTGITFEPDVPSAQVKSAVLLAGLMASGTTTVIERAATRDHTERALGAFGAAVRADARAVTVDGGRRLTACRLRVPGDLSSAAFFLVAAAALPGSDVTIRDVGLNPTRAALVDVLRRAGARVDVTVAGHWNGEPVGDVRVRHANRGDLVIRPAEVPELIDELPVLATLGTFGGSVTVSGAGELRVKESDRIAALVGGLRAMGAAADERADGFQIRAARRLSGGRVDSHGDHRLAMAFAIAALGASGPTEIAGADAVAVSYPTFFGDLDRLAGRLRHRSPRRA
jgi:3-phosphoshikimate 1-carboxyvinyltransferase